MGVVIPQWFVLDVNPYPWKVPPMSVGRKGKALFVQAGRDDGLHTYKEAIREQIATMSPEMIEGPVALYLWFYRHMEVPKTRWGRSNEADNTNLQKATEDALQGFLYENDTSVAFNQSYRVEQSPEAQPLLVVAALPFDMAAPTFPDGVQFQIDELRNRYPLSNNKIDSPGASPF